MQDTILYDNSQYSKDGKLKIAYICGDSAGPAWHEIYVPMKHMNATGQVYAEMFQGAFDALPLYDFDIIVFQRQNSEISHRLVRDLKKAGKKTVYHFTDNFWEIPPSNPAKPHYGPDVLRRMEAIMSDCDMITCTTPYLEEKALKFNSCVRKPYELVEVDEIRSLLPPPRREDDKEIRIGWVLTPHHEDDVYIVVNSLGQIARKYPNTKFIFFGYFNQTLEAAIPLAQVEAYAGVNVWDYFQAVVTLDLDIGIAPVIAHPFNRGKSRRKWFEYSTMETATICSEYETYSKGMTHLENCYKVHKNKAFKWTSGLEYLIENVEERKKIATNALNYVYKNHNAKDHIYKWVDMYTELANK